MSSSPGKLPHTFSCVLPASPSPHQSRWRDKRLTSAVFHMMPCVCRTSWDYSAYWRASRSPMFASQCRLPGKVQGIYWQWTLEGEKRLRLAALTHTDTRAHTHARASPVAWCCLCRLHGNKVIQCVSHSCYSNQIYCTLTLHLTGLLLERNSFMTGDGDNLHVLLSVTRTAAVGCIYQRRLTNRAPAGCRPLGGPVPFLHLLLLWFTSLETLAALLAQNGYQMQAAGIGESWPQRKLSWRSFFFVLFFWKLLRWCAVIYWPPSVSTLRLICDMAEKHTDRRLILMLHFFFKGYEFTVYIFVAETTASLRSLDETSSLSAAPLPPCRPHVTPHRHLC